MIKNKIVISKINNYFTKNKISILEIQKYLKKKGFNVSKKNKSNTRTGSLSSIPRAFLSSLIVGYVGEVYGWHYGFGLAGIGMFLGICVVLEQFAWRFWYSLNLLV